MDLRKVKKLIELAEEAGLAELEVTSGDESVRIALARPMAGPSDVVADVPPRVVARAPASVAKATWVPAPMAGTFYQAPNPGAEPFVRVGDAVQTGEVLCIIESVKMMHEIKAPADGLIVDILVADGEPISTSDRLFELS